VKSAVNVSLPINPLGRRRRSGGISGLMFHPADFAGDVSLLPCRGANCALKDVRR